MQRCGWCIAVIDREGHDGRIWTGMKRSFNIKGSIRALTGTYNNLDHSSSTHLSRPQISLNNCTA